jgi:hypothetical protein
MLVLLMQHEDGVTFTDAVCVGSLTTNGPFVSIIIAGNRHDLIFSLGLISHVQPL